MNAALRPPRRERGYVLALNIAVLAVMLVAATFVGQSVSDAVALARQHQENTQDELKLASARAKVLLLFSAAPRSSKGLGDGNQIVKLDGSPYAMGDDVLVSIQDVRGLVSINGPSLSSPSTGRIERLLGTYGIDNDKALALAESLLDYRDEDGLRRLNGAEAVDYRQVGKEALLRNKDLLDAHEVSRVWGWAQTTALWGGDPITRHLGVAKGVAFNPNMADWRALVAASGLDESTARELVAKRKKGELDNVAPLAFSGGVGDPFGVNAFVTTYPSASALITLRTHRSQWGYQLTVHHAPTEAASPWRIEAVRRVNLGPPGLPYKDYATLPDIEVLKTRDASPLKLPF